MASWFTRTLDRLTPWDRGGEAQRREERKRKEEERQRRQAERQSAPQASQAPQAPRITPQAVQNNLPRPKQTTAMNPFVDVSNRVSVPKPVDYDVTPTDNIFTQKKPSVTNKLTETVKSIPEENRKAYYEKNTNPIDKGLDSGKSWEKIAKENKLPLAQVREYSQATRPNYGIADIQRPKQSFFNKVRDSLFDANTEADKFRRQEANKVAQRNNKPEDVKPITLENPGNILMNTLGEAPQFVGNSFGGVTKSQENANKAQIRAQESMSKSLVNAIDKIQDPNISEAERKRWIDFYMQTRNEANYYGEKFAKDLDKRVQDLAPEKGAAALAVMGLDAASFGLTGTSGRQIVQQGVKQGLKSQGSIIAQQAALNTAQGGGSGVINDLDPEGILASAATGGILGTAADVGLAVGGGGFGRLFRRRVPNAIPALNDQAITQSVEDFIRESQPRPIPVTQNIPVQTAPDIGTPVNVRNITQPKPTIQEFPGDSPVVTRSKSPQEIAEENAARRFREQDFGFPDDRIEGVTARTPEENMVRLGEPSGVTKIEIDTERAMLDEALANGEINKTQYKAANKALDEIKATDEPLPPGRKIEVKQIDGIDVKDQTTVPKDMPETPGRVRVQTQAEPMKAKSEAVAEQAPVVQKVPKVGSTLENGTKVTRKMVERIREDNKTARAYIKAQKQNTELLAEAETSQGVPLGDNPGIVKSGQFKKGKSGVYESATKVDQQTTAATETTTMSGKDLINRAKTNQKNTGNLTAQDVRDIEDVLFENPRFKPGDPEYTELSKLYGEAGTAWGQEGAFRGSAVARRTGTGQQISNRAISKLYALTEDPTKISEAGIKAIQDTSDAFAVARDSARKALDDFNGNPTRANYDKYLKASGDAEASMKAMATAQYSAAREALKGNTNIKLKRLAEDNAKDADIYTMDYIDAALLSGTGTFVRNFVNAGLGSLEEGVFGGVGSRIAGKLAKTTTGGGVGRGSVSGFKMGAKDINTARVARSKNAGLNIIDRFKNWSTTGNQLGDAWISGSAYRSVLKDYTNQLKKAGYSGEELRLRADVAAREDMLNPKGLAQTVYLPRARKNAGLGSGISKQSTPEKWLQRTIADGIADVFGKDYTRGGEVVGKFITRATIGFPSAVARSVGQGLERVLPLLNTDTVRAFTANSPEMRGVAIKESIKKSGTAATVMSTFGAMGAAGTISGSYPSDPDERAKWEREGIKENSIKIGDAWYDIPSYAGSFGVPIMISAALGRHGGLNEDSLKDIRSIAGSISPTDNLSDFNKIFDTDDGFIKYLQNVATTAARSSTPFGSLLAQIGRATDPTQNDTSSDSAVGEVFNKIINGFPGTNRTLPDKTDAEGNVLYNPSTFQTMIGAAGAVQEGGEKRSQQINQQINETVDQISKFGAFDDPVLESILEGDDLGLYRKAKDGKQLDESDIRTLSKALTKGVEASGSDTAYLEREQYDTNLTVLNLKKQLMEADPTTPPSSLKNIETAIKRGEVYKNNKVPYQDIADYKDIGVEDWRKMGIPPGDDDHDPDMYDPDMYEKLWQLDQLMTKAGVSYGKKTDKSKYYLKEKKSGSGSGRSSGGGKTNIDFGTIGASSFAPKLKQYESIQTQGKAMPKISVVRPNLVRKIGIKR